MDHETFMGISAALRGGEIDWDYWKNLRVVSLQDACLLSLNMHPLSKRARTHDEQTALIYRTEVAESHLGDGLAAHGTQADDYYERRPTGVRLAEFRAWAESLPVPFTFPADFPSAAPEDDTANAKEPAGEKPLGERERVTLLCIIGALARQAQLDLSQPMKAGDAVAAMAPELSVTGRTIGDHLKKVGPAMESRTK